MSAASDLMVKQGETDITFIQILNAPRSTVFEAFSHAEHVKQWWMPAPCVITKCSIDFRKGGEWSYTVQLPDGSKHRAKAIYVSIVPNEKIEFDDYFVDEDGQIIKGLPSKHVTVTFSEANGQTELTFQAHLQTVAERQQLVEMGFIQGFTTALGQLVEYTKTI